MEYAMSENSEWLTGLAVGDLVRIRRVAGCDPGFCQPSPPGGWDAGEQPEILFAWVARITNRQLITAGGIRFRRSDGQEFGADYDGPEMSLTQPFRQSKAGDKWEPNGARDDRPIGDGDE